MKKSLSAALLAAALTNPAAAETAVDTAAERAIHAALVDIAAGADRHDWPRVRAAVADTVTADYTSLWGGQAAPQSADDLVAGWADFLPGFDATHHMVTNKTVLHLDNDTAAAEADFTATHRIDGDLWVLGGRYSYRLVRREGRWRVTHLTVTARWETGDRDLAAQAAARAGAH